MRCELKRIIMVLAGICLALPLFGRLSVRDLNVRQRWPWNGLVDITYTVESTMKNSDGSAAEVTLTFQGYDRDQNKKVAMKTLTGDGVGAAVKAGATYTTTWNVAKDYPTFNSSAFKVTVKAVAKARHTPSVKPEPETDVKPGRYLVIDLSAGPEAQSYPHRYSETGPDVTGDVCRSTELWLREIPAGTFMMGSPEGELGWDINDEDQHQVTLTKAFFVGVFEVTQRQWDLVMGKNLSYSKGNDRPVEQVSYDDIRGTGARLGAGWPTHGHNVDASSFLGRLQARTGLVVDLPTEAQWEYACRAGTTTALNSGKNLTNEFNCPNLDQVGRYSANHMDGTGGYKGHTRVGSYKPNAWGLYDMHGNVWEFCLDRYQNHLGTAAVTDPLGPASGSYRLIRGGCWGYSARDCRSASRGSYGPDGRYDRGGFRVACP